MKLAVWGVLVVTAGLLVSSVAGPTSAAGQEMKPGPDGRLLPFDVGIDKRGTTLPAPPGSPPGTTATQRSYNALAAGMPATATVQYDAMTGLPSRVFTRTGALTPNSGQPAEARVRTFLASNPTLYGQTAAEVAALTVNRQYTSEDLGITHVWLGQQFGGIPVFRSEVKADIRVDGRLLQTSGTLTPRLAQSVVATAPQITAARALELAQQYAGAKPQALARVRSGPGPRRPVTFAKGTGLIRPPTVELSYMQTAPGQVSLAWDTSLWLPSGDAFHILVDASTGTLLFRKNYTCQAQGLIYEQNAPRDGTPFTGGTPALLPRVLRNFDGGNVFNGVPLFFPFDPHFNWWAGAPQTTTRSNNVIAGTSRDGVLGTVTSANAANGDFSFSLDLTQDPVAYQEAASTNLFYWVNRVHDIWYRFGFNEASGNFQTANFGPGGLGNDAVIAHAQFDSNGTSRNNAFMSTPPDGQPGLISMFVWTTASPQLDGDVDQDIICHEFGHGVTNRLVGNANGLNAYQSGGMGEGWSDFQAMMVLADSGDVIEGTYPFVGYATNNFPAGIRSQPYSTNVTGPVFTRLYSQIAQPFPSVHSAGEIMCNALWQTYARLVGRLGFTAGRSRMMRLFIAALKLSPTDPSFLDYRDALLLADANLFANEDECDISPPSPHVEWEPMLPPPAPTTARR